MEISVKGLSEVCELSKYAKNPCFPRLAKPQHNEPSLCYSPEMVTTTTTGLCFQEENNPISIKLIPCLVRDCQLNI